MSTLYVVRHGQAQFFSDDYDQLSDLGVQQGRALGEYWSAQGVMPDAIYTGTLVRQRKTAAAAADSAALIGHIWPQPIELPGLDEYPADDIMEKLLPALRQGNPRIDQLAVAFETAAGEQDRYRSFHRLLEAVMARWVANDYGDPASGAASVNALVSWEQFSDGVRAAVSRSMSDAASGSTIAVFTSGGPVGVSVQTVLDAPQMKAAELNWRVYNCSVTRFAFSGSRVVLDSFNGTAHLDSEMLTYR